MSQHYGAVQRTKVYCGVTSGVQDSSHAQYSCSVPHVIETPLKTEALSRSAFCNIRAVHSVITVLVVHVP